MQKRARGRRRRNPTDWSYNNVPGAYITTRGYTMHACPPNPVFSGSRREHMDAFRLINMPARRSFNEGGNGRVYDPVLTLARFCKACPNLYISLFCI
ncbi:MAG: hypothetical protein JW973_06950 [Bacteroidales bacterium]|nr:hypothetical protein [Bacteroidales bacterium]